jgi:hypothetical protein
MTNETARRRHEESLIFLYAVLHSEGTDSGFVGPEAYTVFGATFRKRTQNYEYKIGHEIEYLLRMRKEIKNKS